MGTALTLLWAARAELKYEIDKIQASQRLDLNLEKGRIRDELLTQNSKSIQTGAPPARVAVRNASSRSRRLWRVLIRTRRAQKFGSTRRSTACVPRSRYALCFVTPMPAVLTSRVSQANKNDIIRFCVGAVASTTAVGLGILRLVL